MTNEPVEATRSIAIRICNACYELKGEMCHEPECVFCRRTMAEVGEVLDLLLIRPVVDGERLDLHPIAKPIESSVLVAEHAIKDAFIAGWDAGDSYAFGRYHGRGGADFEVSWEAFLAVRQKPEPDPIAAAVDAQLDPLKDELIAMGHKLAKDGDA
jgi:hypothetical protein